MTVNPLQDGLLPLKAAAQRLPDSVNAATIWRWVTRGSCGIKLDAVLIGARWHVTESAIAEYLEKTTAARRQALETRDAGRLRRQPSKTARSMSIERARRELADDGFSVRGGHA